MKKIKKLYSNMRVALTVMILSLTTLPLTMSAGGLTAEQAQASATSIVGNVISLIVQFTGGITGAIFLVVGLFKFFTAWHNGQPQEMHASVKDIVIGAVFLALAVFIAPAMTLFGL